MSSLPVGTVTFLFTDIEGSTRLWERHPERMLVALARHDAMAEEVVATHAGTLVKSRGEGDSLFAVFARATDAVQAACALQIALGREPWPEGTTLRVRMGLHTGETEAREGDYFGPAVNRCARLRAIAHGGQALLSATVQELVRDALPDGASLRDLGEHRLKDLGRPEHVFGLLHPDLAADFPPLRSLDNAALPNNLPNQPTSFVGREKESAEVRALVGRSRLVTLVGSGGGGKSRLALQVAADLLDRFPGGAWLVELAPLSDPDTVPQAMAQVLSLHEQPGKTLTGTIIEHLKPKETLLVLDNCEHLLAASAGLVFDLLRACPLLHVLASSREALGVAGEQTYRVPSLALPERDRPVEVAVLSEYEAVRLFIERVQSVRPEFHVTDANAPAVAQVCWRLDGIPLAIELAAARVRSMTVEQVMARLDDRFRLLTSGNRTALPRQQTLKALIDWSYGLLTASERAVLRRLSVFAGGWTLEAAESVCADDDSTGAEGIEAFEVLDLLAGLVDKSLVVYEEREEEARYGLLETIRQYARERLREAAESDAARERSKDYFLRLAEEADPKLMQEDSPVWFRNLRAEHDNLRAALEWCMEGDNAAAGLRLCAALDNFWYLGSHVREARASLQNALARAGERPTRERAAALCRYGFFTNYQGDHETARSRLEEALAISNGLEDAAGAGYALKELAWIASHQRDWDQARRLLEESRGRFRQSGDKFGLSQATHELGIQAEYQGDFFHASSLYEEALPMFRDLGNHERVVWTLHGLGFLALCRGDFTQARSRLRESLRMFCDIDDKPGKIRSLDRFASLALAEGQAARAVRLLGAAACAREAIGAPLPPSEREEGEGILNAARVALGEGAFGEAWDDGQAMVLDRAVDVALSDGEGTSQSA